MLKQIDRKYLEDKGFIFIKTQDGREFGSKSYPFVSVTNDQNEITDLLDLTISIENHEGRFHLSGCFETDNVTIDHTSEFFQEKNIDEVLKFDSIYDIEKHST